MGTLCDILIHILEYWCDDYTDYAILNILLFVVAEPALIITFIIGTIQCSKTTNEKLKKRWRITAYSLFIFFLLFITFLTIIPIIKDPKINYEFFHYFSYSDPLFDFIVSY